MIGVWPALPVLLLFSLLGLIAYTDLTRGLIRNWQNALVAGLGFWARYYGGLDLLEGAVGATCGLALGIATNLLYRRYRGVDGLGYGDVKFFGAAGIWLGWQGIAPFVLFASLLGIAYSLLIMGRKDEEGLKFAIRFGPFLGASLAGILLMQSAGLRSWSVA